MDHTKQAYYPQQAQQDGNMQQAQIPMQPPSYYPQQTAVYPGYPPAPHYQQQQLPAPASSFINERFVKGLLIGAAAAYILTNENVQRTAIKGAVKAWSLLQGGVEELKERFHDAEAEIRAEGGE